MAAITNMTAFTANPVLHIHTLKILHWYTSSIPTQPSQIFSPPNLHPSPIHLIPQHHHHRYHLFLSPLLSLRSNLRNIHIYQSITMISKSVPIIHTHARK